MNRKCILLADADSQAAGEFREALGQQWEITSVADGKAALARMKQQTYDVVVASLDLPGLDGPQLLNRIRTQYPDTLRVIAAPNADSERVVKRMLGAHQFLTKPFDRATLKSIIEQALTLDAWVPNENVRKLISRVRSFPTIPSLYLEVLAALRSPDATTEQIGALLARDMAMMTKLLQVLNSAYFGLPRRISDPAEVVGILGFETVKSMVMAVKLLGHYDRLKPIQFSIDRLWRHSTEVAQAAKQLALKETGDQALADTAFTAGLMHDVGKVVLAVNFDEQYHGARSLARKRQLPLWEIETEIFGANHGEIGAYLLGLWGMPPELLEVAALHHFPSRGANKSFSALTVVHVANVLAYKAAASKDDPIAPRFDEGYLAEMGLLEQLTGRRKEAAHEEAGNSDPEGKPDESAAAIPVPPEPEPSEAEPAPAPPVLEAPLVERPSSRGRRRWVYAGAGAALLVLLLAGLGHKLRRGNTDPMHIQAREQTTSRPAASSIIHQEAPAPVVPEHQAAASDPSTMVSAPKDVAVGGPSAAPAVTISTDQIPAAQEPAAIATGFAAVKLQGIVFSTGHPTAIINGKQLRLNDVLAGVRLVEIQPTSVTLEYENQRKTLRLK